LTSKNECANEIATRDEKAIKFFSDVEINAAFSSAIFTARHERLNPLTKTVYNCLKNSKQPGKECKGVALNFSDLVIAEILRTTKDTFLKNHHDKIADCMDSESTKTARDAMKCMEDISVAVIHYGIGGLLIANKFTHQQAKFLISNAADGTLAAYLSTYIGLVPTFIHFKRKKLYGLG